MAKTDLEKLKGRFIFCNHGEYITLHDKHLYIFRSNGELLAARKDIRCPHIAILLPNDRLLVTGSQMLYRVISLKDGSDLWSIPMAKSDSGSICLAFDQISNTVYDYSYDCNFRRDADYITKIDLEAKTRETYELEQDLRVTHDILCDESGILCILQSHGCNVGGVHTSVNGVRYSSSESIQGPGSAYDWKYLWLSEGEKSAKCFLGNTDTILTYDLFVYSPGTNEQYYLLENDPQFRIPTGTMFSEAAIDDSGKYVIVKWNAGRTHTCVIVDYQARKGVARYSGEYVDICLVGNEVWLSTPDGIQRLPFPLIQEIQPDRYVFWGGHGDGFREP